MSAGLVYWSRIHPVLVPMALALEIVFFLRDTMFIADTWATRSIECKTYHSLQHGKEWLTIIFSPSMVGPSELVVIVGPGVGTVRNEDAI